MFTTRKKKPEHRKGGTMKSWQPVRKGAVYCSPACGAGCLHKDYLEVVDSARRLARIMGPGWTPQVRENLGWYAGVVSPCGYLSVRIYFSEAHRAGQRYYSVFLSDTPHQQGGRWTGSSEDPQEAVQQAVAKLALEAEQLNKVLEAVEDQVLTAKSSDG